MQRFSILRRTFGFTAGKTRPKSEVLLTYFGLFSVSSCKTGCETVTIRRIGQFWMEGYAHQAADKAKRSIREKVLAVFTKDHLPAMFENHEARIAADNIRRWREQKEAAAAG